MSSLTEGIFRELKRWVGLGGLIIKRYELLSKAVPTLGRGCLRNLTGLS
jgi:hypothetical protein